MNQRAPVEVFSPGEYIRDELEARGWTQDVLATIIDRSPRLVNEIITGRRAITPETAQVLSEAFGTSAQVWMNLESAYRLSRVRAQGDLVSRRARLYGKGPIKEMVKRGWIVSSDSLDVLEERVKIFFELNDLDADPVPFAHAARKSTSYDAVTPAQCAWLFRAKHLAAGMKVHPFNGRSLRGALVRLHDLRRNAEDIRQVPQVLADAGVRFLIVEHLTKSRIDGSAFWLDDSSPVVALSMRYDRIDWFWYTLMHDLMHIVHRDGHPTASGHGNLRLVETDLVGRNAQAVVGRPPIERRADEAASEFLLPAALVADFAARVRPRYSNEAILEFAKRADVHPGIVVGRLQFLGEISFAHSREMLERVRDTIVEVSFTDGWGRPALEPAA
ncbi:MAG: HigA family addiction module antitoxin [Anaerolineae bacterium]